MEEEVNFGNAEDEGLKGLSTKISKVKTYFLFEMWSKRSQVQHTLTVLKFCCNNNLGKKICV